MPVRVFSTYDWRLTEMSRRFLRSLSAGGLVLGTAFFAASLTPSLIPRTYVVQGALSGACFAAGYGIGVVWRWLWRYMELPEPRDRYLRAIKFSVAVVCAAVVVGFLWRSNAWQNSVRGIMGLEPVTRTHSIEICLIAIITFLVLLLLARFFRTGVRRLSRFANRFLPPRVAQVIGISVGIALLWTVANGLLMRSALRSEEH